MKTIARGNPFCILTGFTFAVAISSLAPSASRAQSPNILAFQGTLESAAGVPKPNGVYSVTFRLFSVATGGGAVWTEVAKPVNVTGGKGAFATTLGAPTSFGTLAFDKPYFLEVQVSPDPPMTPRLPLQGAPYALNAWSVGGNAGTNPAAHFLGTTDGQPLTLKVNNRRVLSLRDVDKTGVARSVNILGGSDANFMDPAVVGGTIAGGGSAGSINDLRGDFGFIGGGSANFLDAYPHAVITGGTGNIAQGVATVIGGGSGNNVQAAYGIIAGGSQNYVVGLNSFVGGGENNGVAGAFAGIASGSSNEATGPASFLGGGHDNTVGGGYAVVGGGESNAASSSYAAIAGGVGNTASGAIAFIGGGAGNAAQGATSTIGGGLGNLAGSDTTTDATVAGGQGNKATGEDSTVGGGLLNLATGRQSTVGGGTENGAYGAISTIGGGWKNYAAGYLATVPGGYFNYAGGSSSFAAGYRAVAEHAGAFVWSDSSADVDFRSSANNQFAIRAVGGMVLETGQNAFIYTGTGANELNRSLLLINSQGRPSASGLKAGGILCADDYGYFSPGKNDMVVKGHVSVGYNFVPQNYTMSINGSVYALNGFSTSDIRYKREIQTMDDALASVVRLRGVTFEWDHDNHPDRNFPTGRQLGFIAQEVEAVLPQVVSTGEDGYKAVSYQNIVPVLVEAVKALKADNDSKAAQIAELDSRLQRLERAAGERASTPQR